MKPAPFAYLAPETEDETLEALRAHGEDGKVLAGGQSLVPLLNMRLAQPAVLIDLNRVAGLAGIRAHDPGRVIGIGTMTRLSAVEADDDLLTAVPMLADAVRWVGHPQIRNRGTFGGSIAHADPAAELPLLLRTLDGVATVRSTRGERQIAGDEFFLGPFMPAIEPDELLTCIDLPISQPRTGQAFLEVARRHGDFALVASAVSLTLDEEHVCHDVRIGLGGVAPVPIRAGTAEEMLRGERPSLSLFREAGRIAAADTEPASDIHVDAEYRRDVAATLTSRALTLAFERVPRSAA